jgi:hypothetical protein
MIFVQARVLDGDGYLVCQGGEKVQVLFAEGFISELIGQLHDPYGLFGYLQGHAGDGFDEKGAFLLPL